MIKCPRCGYDNENSSTNCANCRINLQWAQENVSVIEEQQLEAELADFDAELTRKLERQVIVTTVPSVEGRAVAEYLGILAVEEPCDSISSFLGDAGIKAGFGLTSELFTTAFGKTRESALHKLRAQAVQIGADAVVGTTIDYLQVSSDLVMGAVQGTAVRLSPIAANAADSSPDGSGDAA